jgi:hypothetical protein
MNWIEIFNVFENSRLETPWGEFRIEQVFPDHAAAVEAEYRYCFSYDGLDIFTRHVGAVPVQYAIVPA